MKRTKRKIDEPAPTKAPKTAGSASAGSASEPLSAAVPNPLKDKALIQAAAIAAARELVAGCATFTGAQFSRRVIEQMGYGREFAVNDQGTRTRLHSKDVKLAAFKAVGAGVDGVGLEGCSSWASEWLKAHEVKPGPAAPVALPELPAGGAPPRQLSAAELSAMRARVAAVDAHALRERGALRIPGLLTPGQAEECLLALGAEGALATKELLLRASSGNGEGGGYATIARPPAVLEAASAALRDWLEPRPSAAHTKALLLRYGVGGVNYAHQDQNSSPWQAVLLLNPAQDFEGGALYVLDAAERPPRLDAAGGLVRATPRPLELPFAAAGDAVVFAANSTAFGGRRHLYHGMTRVTRGRRFAVGLFQ